MKNVLILGATGGIGRWLIKYLLDSQGMSLTAYVRTPSKMDEAAAFQMRVLRGDVNDTAKLAEAMQGQDIVVTVLSGDLLGCARSIAAALKGTGVSHVFWVTGMEIHHEVPGEVGKMLDQLVLAAPEYVEAADTIANCSIPSTLVRAAHLTDGENAAYFVQQEGKHLHAEAVDHCAVARYMADRILGDVEMNTSYSVGITN